MRPEVAFVLENAVWPVLLVEKDGTIRRANQAALHLLGPRIKGPSSPLSCVWAEENNAPAGQFLARIDRSSSGCFTLKFIVSSGRKEDFATYLSPVVRDGCLYFVLQLFKAGEIPEMARPTLHETPAAHDAEKIEIGFALENAAWPALLVDADGTIQRVNTAAMHLFGQKIEGISKPLAGIWSPENKLSVEEFLNRSGTSGDAENCKLLLRNGEPHAFISYASRVEGDGQKFLVQLFKETALLPALPPVPQTTVSMEPPQSPKPPSPAVTDIQAPFDANLAHKQKLDCALQLARSVSLDFNNALTSILGHASLLLSKTEPNHAWRGSLVEIEKSAAKAAEIASDLATFSLQEKETRPQSASNLNMLLQRTADLFRKPESGQANVTLQLERKLFAATFDEAKMQQAFVKILENAVQSLQEDGRVNIHSRNLELSEPTQDRTVKLAPGNFICVEISDNGKGIDPDVLPRIFEPFFTTKGKNHRGLGLAWVYGIVTNHGGGVAVSSQPGVGTSVRVYLPAQKKLVKETAITPDDLTGTETILMVDDEDLLLTMGQMILSSYGYTVLTADSGQKALQIFSQDQAKVDLVVTDLVMPHMSGRELIEHIRKISPQTRIICCSGYVRSASVEEDEAYLQKPFTSQDLLRKVKQALTAE